MNIADEDIKNVEKKPQLDNISVLRQQSIDLAIEIQKILDIMRKNYEK